MTFPKTRRKETKESCDRTPYLFVQTRDTRRVCLQTHTYTKSGTLSSCLFRHLDTVINRPIKEKWLKFLRVSENQYEFSSTSVSVIVCLELKGRGESNIELPMFWILPVWLETSKTSLYIRSVHLLVYTDLHLFLCLIYRHN